MVAKNLGGQLKAYDQQFDHMPFDLQVGASKLLGTTTSRLSITRLHPVH